MTLYGNVYYWFEMEPEVFALVIIFKKDIYEVCMISNFMVYYKENNYYGAPVNNYINLNQLGLGNNFEVFMNIFNGESQILTLKKLV